MAVLFYIEKPLDAFASSGSFNMCNHARLHPR